MAALRNSEWTYLHYSSGTHLNNCVAWAVLADANSALAALQRDGWPMSIGDGNPTYSYQIVGGSMKVTYHPLEKTKGYEPLLVRVEHHHASFNESWEFNQSARLLLELWKDPADGNLYSISEGALKEIAVEMTPNAVRMKTNVLEKLMSLRDMHVLQMFEATTEVNLDRSLLPRTTTWYGELARVQAYGGPLMGQDVQFQRLNGLFSYSPTPIEEFLADEDSYSHADTVFTTSMIIDGKPLEWTCNPEALANNFGANPDAPHYLTPVFFRRDVLTHYVDNHEMFHFKNGRLWCGGMWSLAVDDGYNDQVMVWLGDLGLYLPKSEHFHWKKHNLVSTEQVNETTFRRDILAEWVQDDDVFRDLESACISLDKKWKEAFGVHFFVPLSDFDVQRAKSLTFPTNASHFGLSTQIDRLILLTVESINTKNLPTLAEANSSMNRLDAFLADKKAPGDVSYLSNLRLLYEIRSKGGAHRVGKEGLALINQLRAGNTLRENFADLVAGVIENLKLLADFAQENISKP